MNIFRIKLVILTLVIILTGCTKKDEFTLPVTVNLKIDISPDTYGDNYLNFTDGIIGIQKIQFEGKRETGGDIFFETDPEINFPSILFDSFDQTAQITDFDIPQGIYYYMKWNFALKEVVINEIADDDDDDDDDADSPKAGFAIYGSYSYLNGTAIPVIFAVDKTEMLGVNSYSSDGTSSIVLSINKDYEAVLLFDPALAFHSISRESLEEADVSDDNGSEIILISSDENDDLYQILLYRIFQSAKVFVK